MTPNHLTTVGKVAATLLVVSALAVTAVVAVPGVVGADESYVVLSDSMAPALTTGDVVVVRSVPPERIGVGDVITYNSPEAGNMDRISHRVVAVDRSGGETTFRTRGDMNDRRDQYVVEESDLIGRVWFSIPVVGYFLRFAGTDLGIVLLVVVPGVSLVVTELWSVYRDAVTDG